MKKMEEDVKDQNVDLELEKEEIVVIPLPISEAVRITMGLPIENQVIKKYLRELTVKECGIDEYLNMHDSITETQNSKIDNLQKRVWQLEATLNEMGVKSDVVSSNIKKKTKKEKDEES